MTGRTDQEQMRYIDYVYELEDRFPICGVGMVSDPGTCNYAPNPYPDECLDDGKSWGWAGAPPDEEVSELKGGCSTVGAVAGVSGLLLAMVGLARRRD